MAKEFDKDEENVLKNDNMWRMGVFGGWCEFKGNKLGLLCA
jgi:hypothetical protein